MTNAAPNENAAGTSPLDSGQIQEVIETAATTARAMANAAISNDPKAPNAADPLNSGIATTKATDVNDVSDVLELELGGTGTILVAGILAEADYNPELSGRERVRVYDQMRKGDSTVRLGLAAVKYPIYSTNWYIKPGKGGSDNDQYTSFINEELFQNPNFTWTQFMNQAFLFCDYGNSIHEKVFRMRNDGKIGWKKFAPRLPKTIWRWTLQDGVTPGITQILPTGGPVEIPDWKLLMFILDLEGSNYEGTSLLRSAHKHWFYKDIYYKIDAIASERQGMGVPVIHVPAQASPVDKLRAKIIAKNMRVNAQAYVDLPAGFTIEYLDTKAKSIKDVQEMVLHHDRQILKSFFSTFLDLGQTHAGSQSASDNQTDFFATSENYIASVFQDPMNLAIKEVLNLNFSNIKPNQYPTLEHGVIGKVKLDVLAKGLRDLVESGIILPDEDLERHVRQVADMPSALRESSDQHIDWMTRRLPVANINPADPSQVQQKKPIRSFIPAGGGAQPLKNNEGIRAFKEDLLMLAEQVEEAIIAKEDAY